MELLQGVRCVSIFQVLPFMFHTGITEKNTRVGKMENDSNLEQKIIMDLQDQW